MQEQNLLEVPQEEADTAAPVTPEAEAPLQEQQQEAEQDSPEDVSEATGMGWVPKDKFKGDPSHWRPAKEFVRRGKEILPIVQKRERELRDKLSSLEAQRAKDREEFNDITRRLGAMAQIALDRQREQIVASYEAAKRKAVAEGDLDAYDRLSEQEQRAVAEFDPEKEVEKRAPKQEPKQQQVPEAVQNWIAENDWFDRDEELREYASFEHGRLMKRMPGLTIEENLERTKKAVMEKYPEKFGTTRQTQTTQTPQPHSPAVEGGGRQSAGANRERGWESLPPEAKQAGERFIKRDGLFLPKGADPENLTDADLKAARAAYAKEYHAL